MDQTVNLTAHAFEGSNPSLTTSNNKSGLLPILNTHIEEGFAKRGFGGKDSFPPRVLA